MDLRLAVLIDADNVPSDRLKEMMEEVAKYGTPTFKRIYGDWTNPHLNRWKQDLLQHAIIPIQQYGYTQGKNSTDSAMIIDAMDILYSGKVDGFCIVSSDSDFTRLALRLREAAMFVIGMGQRKTPMPFIAACNKFIYIEILTQTKKSDKIAPNVPVEAGIKEIDQELISLLRESADNLADDDGWAFLGEVGSLLLKKQPDFDPRNYGVEKLAQLVKKTSVFLIDERVNEKGARNIKHIYIKSMPEESVNKKHAKTNRRRSNNK